MASFWISIIHLPLAQVYCFANLHHDLYLVHCLRLPHEAASARSFPRPRRTGTAAPAFIPIQQESAPAPLRVQVQGQVHSTRQACSCSSEQPAGTALANLTGSNKGRAANFASHPSHRSVCKRLRAGGSTGLGSWRPQCSATDRLLRGNPARP